MTYRDLIIYILEHRLEDQPILQDGKLTGFLTEEEAAVSFDVGVSTIQAWVRSGMLTHIRIGDAVFIPKGKVPEGASFTVSDIGSIKYIEGFLFD